MSPPIRQVWTFRSDSDPGREYQTLQYTDGTTSCACQGWTRRVAADGSRSCKHTRWVDLGTAAHHCIATHNYETQNPPPKPQPQLLDAKRQITHRSPLGRRKFAL